MKPLSETPRADTERAEQCMAILIAVGLFLTILAIGFFIEYLILSVTN